MSARLLPVLPGVMQIRGGIVNCYLIADADGLVLIDAGMRADMRCILQAIDASGRALRDLRLILITHADGDHVGCAAQLLAAARAVGGAARLCVPAGEAASLAAGKSSRELRAHGLLKVALQLTAKLWAFKPLEFDATLADGEVLPVLGGLRVLNTPGHTPGHCSFYADGLGLLFAGDAFKNFGGRLQVSDGMNTWDERAALHSATRLSALASEVICVGHGPVVQDAAPAMQRVVMAHKLRLEAG